MPGRDWLHIAAIVGLITFGMLANPGSTNAQQPAVQVVAEPNKPVEDFSVPNEHDNDSGAAGGATQDKKETKTDRPASSTPMRSSDGGTRQFSSTKDCDDECQRYKDDLNAQQSMANAAWAMFYLSIFGVILTGIGVVLVYWNLQEAQIVSAEAKRTADAAVRSTELTEKALIGIERPFIYPLIATEVGTFDDDPVDEYGVKKPNVGLRHVRDDIYALRMRFSLTLRNLGKTPCILRTCYYRSEFVPDAVPDRLYECVGKSAPAGIIDIPLDSGGSHTISRVRLEACLVGTSRLRAYQGGTLPFIIFGIVEYDDLFSTRYNRYFCVTAQAPYWRAIEYGGARFNFEKRIEQDG